MRGRGIHSIGKLKFLSSLAEINWRYCCNMHSFFIDQRRSFLLFSICLTASDGQRIMVGCAAQSGKIK
ncbi:hypothetical protein AZH43_05020 [Acinetobacter pragensis]|uniref:Uncharacterized protein n=1 Tax=Acinetobacter pragensis TaxID=1806892 RepID=A0A151XX55_9GAMM|nr:hypothetical protein AZH43_05020 [Acinetobacter pragensis]